MSGSPYQVFGVGVPTMFGRERLFEKLRRHLNKPTPDHVSVIGPAKFGKSVLLNHLAEQFRQTGEYFTTTMYWDLRHGTPVTDDKFRRRFAERIKRTLQQVNSEYADFMELEDEGLHDVLHFLFSEMQTSGTRILAVLDGFDHLLAEGRITRNLWDGLRTLCQMTSLRLVTGSRSRLRELCKTEESRTSDFWEIFFDTPLQVGCFEEHDWDGFLKPFESRSVKFDGSALTEFGNWTGGVPPLSAALAERLYLEVGDGITVSKPHVDRFAMAILDERRDLLETLWDDCQIDIQSDLIAFTKQGIPQSELPPVRRRELELRGFVRSSAKRIRSSCRLMYRYAEEQAGGLENLRRLFGDTERFEANVRSLLQLRLSQITEVDSRLLGYVKNAVRELHPDPTQCTTWARSIAYCALDLIWDAELPQDRSLPHSWKFEGEKRDQLPWERSEQCGLLRRITGTQTRAPVTKYVTKPTCMLVDHVYSVGNFGQHPVGNSISVSIASAFCMSAIALCESLSQDLATHKDPVTGENEEPDNGP